MNNSLTEVHPELVSEWSEKKAKAGRSPAPPRPKTFDYRRKMRIMKKSWSIWQKKRDWETTGGRWIDRGDIYEEKEHHNVIFVGRDADGIPRYAHCRGTGEIKYRGDVAGSDKAFGFCHRGTDNQLFVFEAAIDLLSFIQLFPKDWKKRSYLSLGGVSSVALMSFSFWRPQYYFLFSCAWIMTRQGMRLVRNWQEKSQKDTV